MSESMKFEYSVRTPFLSLSPVQHHKDFILFGSCFEGEVFLGVRSSKRILNELHVGTVFFIGEKEYVFGCMFFHERKFKIAVLELDDVINNPCFEKAKFFEPAFMQLDSELFRSYVPILGTNLRDKVTSFVNIQNQHFKEIMMARSHQLPDSKATPNKDILDTARKLRSKSTDTKVTDAPSIPIPDPISPTVRKIKERKSTTKTTSSPSARLIVKSPIKPKPRKTKTTPPIDIEVEKRKFSEELKQLKNEHKMEIQKLQLQYKNDQKEEIKSLKEALSGKVMTSEIKKLIESSSKQSEAALKAVTELGLLVRNSILQRNVDLSVQEAIPVEPNVKGSKRGRSIPRATSVSDDPISSCDTDNDIQSKRRASSSVERKIVHESEPNPFSIQSLVSDLQHLTSDIRIGAQHGRQCIEEAVRAAHVSIASARRAASSAMREPSLDPDSVLPSVNFRQEPILPSDFSCPADPMINRSGHLYPDTASYGLPRGQIFHQQPNLGTNIGLRRGERLYEQPNLGSSTQPPHPSGYNTSRFANSQIYQNHYF